MSYIIRWIVKWILSGFGAFFSMATSITETGFDNVVIVSLLKAFQTIGLPLVAVSILTLLLKTLLSVSDGENVNMMDIGKRCIFGIIVYMYGVQIMKLLYLVLLSICKDILSAVSGMTDVETNVAEAFRPISSTLMGVIILLMMTYFLFKIFTQLTERFWQMLVMLCMMYVYLPSYVSGDDESLTLWFKQCLSIGLTQIFQSVLTSFAFSIYATDGSFANQFLMIGALAAASKVEQLLDRYGLSVGGKIGGTIRNGMSMAFYSRSIFRR